jgi:tetratricopeptide (TPR) repeat protein
MLISACGTMPVPSMSQPAPVVAESTVTTTGDKTDPNTDTTGSSDPALSSDNRPTNQASTVASTAHVEVIESEQVSTSIEDVESKSVSVVNSTHAAESNTALSESKPVEDILQRPVISKSQPSQAVLSAIAPANQYDSNQPNYEQQFNKGEGAEPVSVLPTGSSETEAEKTASASVKKPTLISKTQSSGDEVPKFALLTANDRVQSAITLLNDGDIQQAEKLLADALVIEPNNRAARKLMRQFHESPEDFFAIDESFDYVVGPNETLLSVAEKFLDDPLDFYMLAKLNDIKYPDSLVAGKTLKIPGESPVAQDGGTRSPSVEPLEVQNTAPAAIVKEKDSQTLQIERAKVYLAEHRYKEAIALLKPHANKEPARQYTQSRELLSLCYLDLANSLVHKGDLLEAQATLESSVEALPEKKFLKTELVKVRKLREAERLYRLGLQESQTGKEVQAITTFAKALQLNPAHEQAKKQITDLRLTVVEESHKKAMVLYRKQELSRAIEMWDGILELDPSYELAKQYRAKAIELKRKIDQL